MLFFDTRLSANDGTSCGSSHNQAVAFGDTPALRLGFIRHREPIPFTSLHLGDDVCLIHLPGESFVEYQLFAQQQRPGGFVCTASYGDGVPGYIPLEKSFAEGGYETTQAFAAPRSEQQMKDAIAELLKP